MTEPVPVETILTERLLRMAIRLIRCQEAIEAAKERNDRS